jgi:hypothetical protein
MQICFEHVHLDVRSNEDDKAKNTFTLSLSQHWPRCRLLARDITIRVLGLCGGYLPSRSQLRYSSTTKFENTSSVAIQVAGLNKKPTISLCVCVCAWRFLFLFILDQFSNSLLVSVFLLFFSGLFVWLSACIKQFVHIPNVCISMHALSLLFSH